MFIIMKTAARTAENGSIHLYRHRMYVKIPERYAKNEYQSRVSPIVLNGGRSRPTHNHAMKAATDATESRERHMAATLRDADLKHDRTAPVDESRMADMPKYMNSFHVTIRHRFSFFDRARKKHQKGSANDHKDTGQS